VELQPVITRPRIFQDQDRFFKNHQIINPRPQKKRFLTQKIRPVLPVLSSHAGIMPVTEKSLLITCFAVKFCFIQN